ncbi:MAG: universal stress protein [Rhizomicrobium sp.]
MLAAAYALIQEGGGHLECLYVYDDAAAIASCIQTDAMGVPVVTPELLTELNNEAAAQKNKAMQDFDAFCAQHDIKSSQSETPAGAVSASWHALSADVVTSISEESRYHDATVLTRDSGVAGLSTTDLGAIAISSGRPLVLIPDGWQPRPFSRIVVAWKETAEAARATAITLPLLARAKKVTVIAIAETGDPHVGRKSARACARYLQQHEVDVEHVQVSADSKSASSALLSEAGRRAADLVVMGAYGHSRLREFVFGGFTRDVLASAEMPILFMH